MDGRLNEDAFWLCAVTTAAATCAADINPLQSRAAATGYFISAAIAAFSKREKQSTSFNHRNGK